MTAPTPVTIDLRDPSTVDPVAFVTTHLDAGVIVAFKNCGEGWAPFSLDRRGVGVVVLDEVGTALATFADVEAALRYGATRRALSSEAAADKAIRAASRPPRPRRSLRRALASLKGRGTPCR